MKNIFGSFAIAAALGTSSASIAGISINGTDIELHPMQAHTIHLSDHIAVVYYVVQKNGDYQIVTTIGPNVGVTGNANQHRVTMSEGQTWSLDMDNGGRSTTITFSTNDKSLFLVSREPKSKT